MSLKQALHLLAPRGSAGGGDALLGVRIAFFFAALFTAYGLVLPYFPVWLDSRGLTPVEISVITSAPLFVRVVFTPAVAMLAERIANYRMVIIVLAWCAFAIALAVSQLFGYWPILVMGVAMLMCVGTMLPLTDTIAVAGVKSAGLDYGGVRIWGSITFIIANFSGGVLIEGLGGGAGIWLIVSTLAMTAVAAHFLPAPIPRAPQETAPRTHWRLSMPVKLLRTRLFALFLLAGGCIHGAHATFYTFGALHWQSIGLSSAWIGALWAIGVLAEVILFAFSAGVSRRLTPVQLILAGGAASVVRWTAMVFNPSLMLLVPLQVLHALSYGAVQLGAVLFIARAVPHAGMGNAQAFYAVIANGLVLGLVGLASGVLYTTLGSTLYALPAVVSLVGTLAALLLLRQWDGGLLLPEPEVSPTAQAQAD
jgi:MFS transporter, PPP family, 3-phenylpropionic acid transporter